MGRKEFNDGRSLREKFKSANVRHYSQLDSVLSKYMDVEEDETQAVLPEEIGATSEESANESNDDEEEDEFDIDFKKIFSNKLISRGKDVPGKFTSTPRTDLASQLARKNSEMNGASPLLIRHNKPKEKPGVSKSNGVSEEAQKKLLSMFNFKKMQEEPEIRLIDLDKITSNAVTVERKAKVPVNAEPRTSKSPSRVANSRASLTLVSAVNSPSRPAPQPAPDSPDHSAAPASQENKRPDDSEEAARRQTAKHRGRGVLQPELAAAFAKSSALLSTKSKEQRAEEERRAREAAEKVKWRRRGEDPFLAFVQNSARLPTIPKRSS